MSIKIISNTITERPKFIIFIILALTIIFGYFASTIEVSTDWRTFLPDDNEEVNAYFEIIDEYGNIEFVQILVESNNDENDILTREAFSEMLNVENAIVENAQLNSTLLKSSQLPYGLLSIADIVTQTVYTEHLNMKLNEIMSNMNDSNMVIDQNILLEDITRSLMSLTFQDKLIVTEGGSISTNLLNMDLQLDFSGLDDTIIKGTIHWLLSNDSIADQRKNSINSLFSNDFDANSIQPKAKATFIMVQLDGSSTQDNIEECELKIIEITDMYEESTRMNVMGLGLMDHTIEKLTEETVMTVVPISLALVTVILLIIYRRISDTILGLIGLGIAMVWMLGIGSFFGSSINEITAVTPALLIGLGIDYSIHIILRYREGLREGRGIIDSSKASISFVGSALLLATATTMIAFLSNISSPLPPIREFGILSSIGIASSFIIMITFVPSIRILLDEHRKKRGKAVINGSNELNKVNKENGNKDDMGRIEVFSKDKVKIQWHEVKGSGIQVLNKILGAGAYSAEHHPYITLAVVAIIASVSLFGALQVETEYDEKEFLPDNIDLTYTMQYLDDNFQTSMTKLALILVEGNITNPEIVRAVNETIDNMRDDKHIIVIQDMPMVESIFTLMSQYAEVNHTFAGMYSNSDNNNDGRPDTNFTMLFEWIYTNSDEGELFLHRTDGRFDGTVIRIQTNAETTSIEQERLYNDLEVDIAPLNDMKRNGEITSVVLTGMPILGYIITSDLQKSVNNSIIITIMVCFVILTLLFGILKKSWILGIITTLPVVFVLLMGVGTMYLLGISINPMTSLVGSLTIGLGITYSIHITQRFLEEIDRFDDIDKACRYTVSHTGTALFGAAVTTIAGFGALGFSDLTPLRQFGMIIIITIFYSMIVSVFILPVMLVIWAKWNRKKMMKINRQIKNSPLENRNWNGEIHNGGEKYHR